MRDERDMRKRDEREGEFQCSERERDFSEPVTSQAAVMKVHASLDFLWI